MSIKQKHKLMVAIALVALVAPGISLAQVVSGPTSPSQSSPLSFGVSSLSVKSQGTVTFSWNVPSSVSSQPLFFDIGPCPAGITMFDVTNNKSFLCGDLGRSIPWSGSDVVRFMNTNATSVRMSAYIENMATTLILQAPITIAAQTPPPAGSLNVTKNSSFTSQTVTPGTANNKIGSYSFTASPVEAMSVKMVDVSVPLASATPSPFQNLKLMINGAQFGATQGMVNGNTPYAFSGAGLYVAPGATVNVDVYADVLSSAMGSYAPATAIVGYSSVGATSNVSVTSLGVVTGQSINIMNAPSPTLTVSADSSEPAPGRIVQNSVGNALAAFRFAQTSKSESVKVTRLNVVSAVASTKNVKPAFNNLTLWNGSTMLGTAQSPVADVAGTGYIYTFNFANPLIVSPGSSMTLVLKGDAGSYANGSFTDGSSLTFGIMTTTDPNNNTASLAVVAQGATSNAAASVTLSNAVGTPQTVVRTTLAVIGQPVTTLPPTAFARIGSITLSANSAGSAVLNALKITTDQSNAAFLGSLQLRDQGGNDLVTVDGLAKSAISGNAVTWTFSPSAKPLAIIPGSSYTVGLWGDLSKIPATPNVTQSLTASVTAPADLSYYDGADSGAIQLTLLPPATPVVVANLTIAPGASFASSAKK